MSLSRCVKLKGRDVACLKVIGGSSEFYSKCPLLPTRTLSCGKLPGQQRVAPHAARLEGSRHQTIRANLPRRYDNARIVRYAALFRKGSIIPVLPGISQ